jgi:hypothetical protein
MKNKNLFLASLFLLLPAAIQCMEKEIIFKPKTMQDIRNERDFIYNHTYHHEDPVNNVLFQKNWPRFLNLLEYQQKIESSPTYIFDSLEDEDLSYYQKYTFQGYSLLGIATIALHILLEENVSFKEQKEFIPKLLAFDFKRTEKDPYLALLAKYEEFGPCIIKKICTFQHAPILTEIKMPEEVIPLITLLMWNIEESLL